MPDLDDTNRDQENLLELCRDRPHPTEGPFHPNSFYGIAGILRRYAGLPTSFPIAAVIPHGVALDPSFVWGTEIEARVPAVLSYPAYRDEIYESATSKRVVPAASPYVYVVRMLESVSSEERHGTIFFLKHSTHHVTTEMAPESTAAALSRVDDRYKPVTVCMYWRDIQLGRHAAYVDRGLKVVSAGHIFDDGFLYRLHWLCSQHVYSSGESLGSHTFFSVESGCRYVPLLDPEPDLTLLRTKETFGRRIATGVGREIITEAKRSFMSRGSNLRDQERLVDYFLRRDSALPPQQLAALLRELRSRDRWGYRQDADSAWVPPGWLRRSFPSRGMRYLRNRFHR